MSYAEAKLTQLSKRLQHCNNVNWVLIGRAVNEHTTSPKIAGRFLLFAVHPHIRACCQTPTVRHGGMSRCQRIVSI